MKYGITMPIAGYIYKEIEANSEKEALDILYNEGYDDNDIEELDMYDKICGGNVCYVNQSYVEIEELGD